MAVRTHCGVATGLLSAARASVQTKFGGSAEIVCFVVCKRRWLAWLCLPEWNSSQISLFKVTVSVTERASLIQMAWQQSRQLRQRAAMPPAFEMVGSPSGCLGSCAICRDELRRDLVALPCRHVFHDSCALAWSRSGRPTCRCCPASQKAGGACLFRVGRRGDGRVTQIDIQISSKGKARGVPDEAHEVLDVISHFCPTAQCAEMEKPQQIPLYSSVRPWGDGG